MTSSTSTPRLYFAYGSNLCLAQMASRCPTSTYYSFGLLRNYKWIIGERGYANVIQTDESEAHIVYGLLYMLQPSDEALLERAEGVPYPYAKHILEIEVLAPMEKGKKVQALVYVDVRRLREGVCKEEYVGRINRRVRDAREKGMEKWYVERYIRSFVRSEEVGERVEDPFHPLIGKGES